MMTCTCTNVDEMRTWLRQLTRASFAVETTSSSVELFCERVDCAGLLRVVRCDSEPAMERMQKSSGIRPGSNPSPRFFAINNNWVVPVYGNV